MDPFEVLPPELCLLALTSLSLSDIASALRVSKKWRNNIDQGEQLWEHFCKIHEACRTGDDSSLSWRELLKLTAGSFAQSKILNSDHKRLLQSWLPKLRWTLIYRGTRDGWSVSEYQKLCHDRDQSVTVGLSKNGSIFGGYSPTDMQMKKGWTVEQQKAAFLFSLENPFDSAPMQIWPKQEEVHRSVVWCSGVGQLFGDGFDLGILGYPSTEVPYAWCRIGRTYQIPQEKMPDKIQHQAAYLDGLLDILLEELEVFIPYRCTIN